MKLSQIARRTSLIYGVAGLLWILLSDRLLSLLVSDSAVVARLGTLKGIGFVVVTGVLLYFVLRRELVRWEREAVAREAAQNQLRKTEARIAELAVAVPGTIYSFRLRPDGAIEMPYASPKLKSMFEVDPAKVVDDARLLIQMVAAEDRGKLWASIEESARALTPWHCLFRVQHPVRGMVWVEGRSTPEREADGSVLWHGLLLDATERRRIEAELAGQRTELQMILDSVPAFVFYKDRDHRMLRVNEEVLRVIGRGRAEVEGRTEIENGSPYAGGYYRDEDEVIRTGRPKRGIVEKLVTADGERWMRTDKFPNRDEQGQIVGVVGFAVDITEQVRAGELERRQHRILEAIREAQAAFIVEHSLKAALGRLLTPVLDLTGSEFGFIGEVPVDQSGRPYLRLHALTNIAWDEQTRELFARQEANGLVLSNLDSLFGSVITSGELVIANDPKHDPRRGGLPVGHPPIRAFMGIPLKLGGRLLGIIGLANRLGGFEPQQAAEFEPLFTTCVSLIEAGREARRRQEAESARQRSEARFQSLVESMDQIFWTSLPGDPQATYISPAVETITGRPAEEFLRDPDAWLAIVHPEDRPRLLEAIAREVDGSRGPLEYRITGADQSERWIWSRAFPVRDAHGKIVAINGIATDITARKLAERALRESERRFERIFESSPVIHSMSSDPDGRCLAVNRHFTEKLGYTLEDLRGRASDSVGLWEVPEQRAKLIADLDSGHPVLARECLVRTKAGNLVTLLVSLDRIELNGQMNLLFAAVDITARKQAEAGVEALTAWQRAVLDNAAHAIIATREDGIIQSFNRAAETLTGYAAAEVVGQATPVLFHDAAETAQEAHALSVELGTELPPGFEVFVAAARLGRGSAREWTYVRKDGTRVPVQLAVTSLRSEGGQITGFVGLATDISERRKAQRELARRDVILAAAEFAGEQFLREQNWKVAIQSVLGRVGSAADASRAYLFENHPGPGGELLVSQRFEWCAPGIAPQIDNPTLQGFRYDAGGMGRWRREFEAGHAVHLSLSAAGENERLLMEPQGAQAAALMPIFVLGHWWGLIGFDECRFERDWRSTELEALRVVADMLGAAIGRQCADAIRQNLEAQLRQSQKMEAIGQLAGGVAHDFNNLLTIILGNTSLLLGTGGLPAEDANLVREIQHASERAAALTRQLLLFGRKSVIQARDLDLNEVVGNLTKMLRRILGEHILLRTSFGPALRAVHADAGMIEQVIVNLAVNARDAMPAGGTLTLATDVVQLDVGRLPENPEARAGTFVCLSVADTGSGIAPELLPRLFEPFFTTKEVGKGTGLGLATVYGIVQQHGGWVDVENSPGAGATFRVFLPALSRSASATESRPGLPATVPGGTESILVVEDEPSLRHLVVNVVKRFGYGVLAAETGREALRIWDQHRDQIDLLFTDIVMPDGMTGRELAGRLSEQRPGLKVIFTSGYSADLANLDVGAVEGLNFLQKPFTPTQIAEAIRRCLDAA